MTRRKVVVRGGWLFRISENRGRFYIEKFGGILLAATSIGKTSSLEDALTFIKVHSGKEIEEISEW